MKTTALLITLLTIVFNLYHAQKTEIPFEDIKVEIEGVTLWNQPEISEKQFHTDAEVFVAELGETVEDKRLIITTSSLTAVKVEMRFETSISLMAEGPHCDLINWKHHHSKWAPLEMLAPNNFRTITYSIAEKEQFPKVTTQEIVEATQQECPEWVTLAKTVEGPLQYPSLVTVSSYFLRISGVSKAGKKVVHMVKVNVPMEC